MNEHLSRCDITLDMRVLLSCQDLQLLLLLNKYYKLPHVSFLISKCKLAALAANVTLSLASALALSL